MLDARNGEADSVTSGRLERWRRPRRSASNGRSAKLDGDFTGPVGSPKAEGDHGAKIETVPMELGGELFPRALHERRGLADR